MCVAGAKERRLDQMEFSTCHRLPDLNEPSSSHVQILDHEDNAMIRPLTLRS